MRVYDKGNTIGTCKSCVVSGTSVDLQGAKLVYPLKSKSMLSPKGKSALRSCLNHLETQGVRATLYYLGDKYKYFEITEEEYISICRIVLEYAEAPKDSDFDDDEVSEIADDHMDDYKDRLAYNMKYYRSILGLSAKELSNLSGVSPNTISLAETCRGNVGLPVLDKICKVLGVTLPDLLMERY